MGLTFLLDDTALETYNRMDSAKCGPVLHFRNICSTGTRLFSYWKGAVGSSPLLWLSILFRDINKLIPKNNWFCFRLHRTAASAWGLEEGFLRITRHLVLILLISQAMPLSPSKWILVRDQESSQSVTIGTGTKEKISKASGCYSGQMTFSQKWQTTPNRNSSSSSSSK